MKKLTIEFIKEQFVSKGYTLLTEKYINSKSYLEYICPKGHTGKIIWNSWQQGIRCSECAGVKKPIIEFVRESFEKEGYTLLTEEYTNNRQKLEYICPKNHVNSITWANWQSGQRCADCANCKKLTIEFIRKEFKKDGYTLLTKEYINAYQKLAYICAVGHKWSICWSKWKLGRRCPKCRVLNMSGEKHPRWNSNLTDEDRQKIRSSECKIWAKQVKKRDNFICQLCGDKKGSNLVSHHLESYNSTPELRAELSNGICLCEKCHNNFHNRYGRGNNTRKQFEEFSGIVVASI